TGQSPEQKDRLLLHRNVKMARRMDSLSALRSMFFAVGCAHLPGDSGVIDLLRRKGFSVEPVFSAKKIASTNYTFQEVHIPWMSVTDEQGTYTAEMPANPATVKLYGLLEMKFLMDLFNMSGFCTMSVANPGHSGSKDSLFKSVAGKMFHGTAPSGKSLVKNGIPGKEYIHYDSSGNIRVQLFVDSNRVYMALISALKKDVLLSADAEKFFQSYTITGVVPPQAGSTATRFTDSMVGISFISPARLTYNKKMSKSEDESYDMNTYTGIDQKTGAMIMVLSRTLRPGYHITDLSGTYEGMEKVFTTQYTHLQKDSANLDGV
ncbi:MAG: TraB/GumN family protein, partial [Chitinophaga rupis]